MKKQTVYIFAAFIVVLLILAIVIMWLTGGIGGTDTPEASPTPEITHTDTPTPTLSPTPTVAPTDALTTPEPTTTPEPPLTPSGTVIGTGAFDSNTGVGLNTHTVWTAAEQSDGSVLLSLSVYVRAYSIEIGQRAVSINVNGTAVTGVTRAFSVDSPNDTTDTLVYSYTATVSRGRTDISVDWNYDGQYSGQELELIHSEASITI